MRQQTNIILYVPQKHRGNTLYQGNRAEARRWGLDPLEHWCPLSLKTLLLDWLILHLATPLQLDLASSVSKQRNNTCGIVFWMWYTTMPAKCHLNCPIVYPHGVRQTKTRKESTELSYIAHVKVSHNYFFFFYLLDEAPSSLDAAESRTNRLVGIGLLGNKRRRMDLQYFSVQ